MKGKVQTVLGDVNPSELGVVLPHEHLEMNCDALYVEPSYKPELKNSQFTLKNLGWIRQFPYGNYCNLNVEGPELLNIFHEEIKQFKANGGGTIVDNTTKDIPRYEKKLQNAQAFSRASGVHIVAGTGFYVTAAASTSSLAMSEESMAEMMTKDLTQESQDDLRAKFGIIGEIGCSWPLTDFERRNLRASGEVERTLGCPVTVHPGRNNRAPEEIVRVFSEAGGDLKRLVMGHLDRTIHTIEEILEFASMGTYLEYDLFGIETSFYQHHEEIYMPSDGQRIQRIHELLKEGYGDRVLVSHDIHTRHRLERFGGHGFSHILKVVVPMMLTKGITQESIDKMLIHNPAEWLTFIK